MKIDTNELGHITNMAAHIWKKNFKNLLLENAMLIYGKNLKKSSPEPIDR